MGVTDIPENKFKNLSKEESQALYQLKNDNAIVIKGAVKGCGAILCGMKDYFKKPHKQLSDEKVYEEVTNDPSKLESTILTALNQISQSNFFFQ